MDETATLMPAARPLDLAPPETLVLALRSELASLQQVPLSDRLDALLADQRSRWKKGQRVSVEAYRLACPDFADDETILHLITSEALLRRTLGEPVDPSEYLERFPQHSDSIQKQFQVESALESMAFSPDFTFDNRETIDLPSSSVSAPTARGAGVPGFEILSELGRGGMGVVYKARQLGLNRTVALKMILSSKVTSESARERFRREAEAVAQLKHPNIVPIYAIGEDARQVYFALEYVNGGSLASKLDGKPWAARTAAELVAVLAGAVQHAHEKGIIHRDLKPANVLIDDQGTPHVTDFGLARQVQESGLTLDGAVLGTPAYMAPEQAAGLNDNIGPATDVFGLGAILYQLLTGRPPYQGPNALTTLRQAEQGKVLPVREVNPKVPASLARICDRALATDPKLRHASAAALANDLRRHLTWARRLALPAGIGAAYLLVAGCVVLMASLSHGPQSRGPDHASLDREASAPGKAAGEVLKFAGPRTADTGKQLALDGDLILSVWSPTKDGPKKGARIEDPGTLPVMNGEMVHLHARLNRKAYVYLVWVDAKGTVDPLYPWNEKQRENPRALYNPAPILEPQSNVESPTATDRGWTIEGESGLETALLLAREAPLPADINLGQILGKISPSPFRDPGEYAVRGYNKELKIAPIDVKRGLSKVAAKIDDPLLQMMERVRKHFEVVRAVRFAHR
jgi:tRNA A-37 threonylcarbamoyl transferase component Bud32